MYDQVRQGLVGSLLNVTGAETTRKMQQLAVENSRLKIPMIFGLDVIHGYRTIFPVPLAEAATFDVAAIEQSARISAIEAAAAGVHWTFAPMVDVARDARWGRIMEGSGEDVYLGAQAAAARVRGFQGKDLAAVDTIAACAKHYAGYAYAEAGRDYNTVDVSEQTLRNVILPPFKAAADAGAATFMNSFNEIGGIPSTGNPHLQRDILKGEWGFQGFVVSDWGSIGEMIPHGFSENLEQAARQAITAGSDMDMESRAYVGHLAGLVTGGKVDVKLVDDAVRRVLRVKFALGLFDDPYRYSDAAREKQALANPAHLAASRDVAPQVDRPAQERGRAPAARQGREDDRGRGPAGRRQGRAARQLARPGCRELGRLAPRGHKGRGAVLDPGRPRRGREARHRPAQLHGALGDQHDRPRPASRPRSRPRGRPTWWWSRSARTRSSRARAAARRTSASRASRRSC